MKNTSTPWLALLLAAPLPALAGTEVIDALLDLPIENLMDVEITSVSKRKEKASEAPAAVYVITQEDIRRSGATSIPEALRMAPGMQVARIDGNKWAVSARGFNGQFANKLLVLMDGRSVYTPLFSGVFWDEQDTLLEDIDRIEIIRGPGATLWGANAVNGVINIITKTARETQGNLALAGAGNQERAFTGYRHGGQAGDAYYRLYGKAFDRDEERALGGSSGEDGWKSARGGFRADWEKQGQNAFTLQGDLYHGREEQRYELPILTSPYAAVQDKKTTFEGGNLLARWTRDFSPTSQMALQAYLDYASREYLVVNHAVTTLDLDFQHGFSAGERHEMMWGAGYRRTAYDTDSTPYITFSASGESATDDLLSAFVQDKITLKAERLFLTLGSKFEHNAYSGFEVQPSARLLWQASENHSFWLSASRAVRTPSHGVDAEVTPLAIFPLLPSLPPTLVTWQLDRAADAEKLFAYEAGYKAQLSQDITLDTTVFYNVYDDLLLRTIGTPSLALSPTPHLVLPLRFQSSVEGESYGFEAAAQWRVTPAWQLSAGYSYLRFLLDAKLASAAAAVEENEENAPRHQFHLRSYLDLPHGVSFDTALYYVDDLDAYAIPSYLRLDARLGWQAREGLELSLTGQNLLDNAHPEFQNSLFAPEAEIGRSVYAKAAWKF